MKVSVTSLGETLESPIDQRFGRARFFIVYDTENRRWAAHSNSQNLDALQGAGVQAAQNIIQLGADVVITGHCGPKAFKTLAAGGVTVYQNASGAVGDALKQYENGKLTAADTADVEEGFGSV